MPDTPLNPDAVDRVAKTLMDDAGYTWENATEKFRDGFRHHARIALAAALPEVTSDVYTVAIKNTEKSTGRVFFDYPGCTPEIGTLDDARELLNWVNEGMPSSPDSPYSSEARIYKLTEVDDA